MHVLRESTTHTHTKKKTCNNNNTGPEPKLDNVLEHQHLNSSPAATAVTETGRDPPSAGILSEPQGGLHFH